MSEPGSPSPHPSIRRIFICTNGKCASAQQAQEIYDLVLEMIQAQNLDDFDAPYRVKATTCGCLDVCQDGPVMMIQPDAVRYCRVDRRVLQEIFSQHILAGHILHQYTCTPGSGSESSSPAER